MKALKIGLITVAILLFLTAALLWPIPVIGTALAFLAMWASARYANSKDDDL